MILEDCLVFLGKYSVLFDLSSYNFDVEWFVFIKNVKGFY